MRTHILDTLLTKLNCLKHNFNNKWSGINYLQKAFYLLILLLLLPPLLPTHKDSINNRKNSLKLKFTSKDLKDHRPPAPL